MKERRMEEKSVFIFVISGEYKKSRSKIESKTVSPTPTQTT
jgi:hypothetical protein